MTLERPMFPPRAEQNNCSDSEQLSLRENRSDAERFKPKNPSEMEAFLGGVVMERRKTTSDKSLGIIKEQCSSPPATSCSGGSRLEGPEAGPPGAEYYRTDISPAALFCALGGLRRQAEAEIERLLAFLDELDADSDFELSGDDEPELGSVAGRRDDQSHWAAGIDAEPSLGATERHPDGELGESWIYDDARRDRDGAQADWSAGVDDDREGQHDGREPDVDDELSGDENEPLLGSFDRLINQDHSWRQTRGSNRTWPVYRNCDAEIDAAT